MGEESAPPSVVVVSLQKSGTNLVARMMADAFGYRCIGHGIRDSFDELLTRLHAKEPGVSDRRSLFSRPGMMLDVLEEYPPRTCLFLHGLEVGSHLLNWCSTREPRILFNYRDPRDSLLSLVNYLLQRANEPYSQFARNVIFAEILEAMPSASAQLDFAITHMGEHVEKYNRNSWLLFHPSVAKLSFEELVGTDGGGSESQQRATIRRVGEFLGIAPRDEEPRLFDSSVRTFFRGQIGAWRDVYSPEQTRTFGRLYGDVLRTYGYPEL
ncbi:sulfotransferase domain-containing protein [Catellatospora tritici]|uniref:sulfotransferase domain-containing protein n=1 Tax=Catellatospora tritici TaxID=2851566 RepID=UPI001C2DD259|nr:sulfotransferase domain-containing protein [Catellatospora tritici]